MKGNWYNCSKKGGKKLLLEGLKSSTDCLVMHVCMHACTETISQTCRLRCLDIPLPSNILSTGNPRLQWRQDFMSVRVQQSLCQFCGRTTISNWLGTEEKIMWICGLWKLPEEEMSGGINTKKISAEEFDVSSYVTSYKKPFFILNSLGHLTTLKG